MPSFTGYLLIGVTSFFRDEEAFRHLGENVVIPLLKKKKSIRLWGLSHVLPVKKYIPWQYCSANVWNTCILLRMSNIYHRCGLNRHHYRQKGIYSESLLENLNQAILDRYFEHTSGGYLAGEKIRKMIVFAKHNIFRDVPFSKLGSDRLP